ncbi:MAG TPA: efflux RND transporter periplasmic adaptor subunit, partial [Nitrospirae bacterium]|nr:efflux RND transporter periplasmic adaptor subunit [Nitrospirota bacterium]
ERDVAEASYRRAAARRSQLDAEREAFNALKEKIKETEARDELTRLDYNRSFITSPIDGVITALPVKVGETLARGAPVATVSDTANLHIEAPVDEADAAKVSKGQEVRIIMDAYPDKVFYGTVSAISPVVLGKRLESKTFRVKVDFKNHPPMLKLGMSADVEIIVGKVRDSLIVPTQSIMEVKGKRYVYMISDNKARYREVQTGLYNWNFTEVGSGLKDGDVIVTNPDTPGLKDGVSVVYKKEQ